MLALMCLNAARLPARLSAGGALLPWAQQDRSHWDSRLVAEGLKRFDLSAAGEEVTAFHLEAAIAVTHASAPSHDLTNYARIVDLYDRLLALAPSPVGALGRAMALAERDGPERGLLELQQLPGRERIAPYPFYPAALGELELRTGRLAAASEHFRLALSRARSDVERDYLKQRLALASH